MGNGNITNYQLPNLFIRDIYDAVSLRKTT